jgi:hypothetical protein
MRARVLGGLTAAMVAMTFACVENQSTRTAEVVPNPQPAQVVRLQQLVELFNPAAIVGTPRLVGCRLSEGTETTCLSITITTTPTGLQAGPWCPRNISDGPEQSGIWLDNGRVYDADGAFVKHLSTFYQDNDWQLFDPATGAIRVTDSKEACAAAARPDVDPAYTNYCVECLTSYLDAGATMTYTIPIDPVRAVRSGGRIAGAGVGLAFRGVRLDGPAPVDAILGAHTLAPFDDCGGHVNLHAGYHIHAITGCLNDSAIANPHAPEIGIAMDGVSLHSRLNTDGSAPEDLDACGGHTIPGDGYHYHVGAPGANAVLRCHGAQVGCAFDDPDRYCDASVRQPPPR